MTNPCITIPMRYDWSGTWPHRNPGCVWPVRLQCINYFIAPTEDVPSRLYRELREQPAGWRTLRD